MSLGANGAGRCIPRDNGPPLSSDPAFERDRFFFFFLLLLLKTLKIFFQFSVTHFPIKTNEIVRGPAESVEIPTIQQLTLFGRMSSGKKKDRDRERERERVQTHVLVLTCVDIPHMELWGLRGDENLTPRYVGHVAFRFGHFPTQKGSK